VRNRWVKMKERVLKEKELVKGFEKWIMVA
jgi:hypothetical protein